MEASKCHTTFVCGEYLTGIGFQTICDGANNASRPASIYQILRARKENVHFY